MAPRRSDCRTVVPDAGNFATNCRHLDLAIPRFDPAVWSGQMCVVRQPSRVGPRPSGRGIGQKVQNSNGSTETVILSFDDCWTVKLTSFEAFASPNAHRGLGFYLCLDLDRFFLCRLRDRRPCATHRRLADLTNRACELRSRCARAGSA